MSNALDEACEAQARALREFGYSDVTAEDVLAAHGRWLRGETASDVISRFCEGAFEGHPRLFGERP